ncbi:hypothetical protein BC827DRAFT_208033 [Russula dissimulans]|nr:hypothetical protein BC827DRAFT_208033 [Russula dissimulans]
MCKCRFLSLAFFNFSLAGLAAPFRAAPVLLGTIGDWTLYGMLVVQFYVYSYNFPEDRKLFKLLAYSLMLLETLQTSLGAADLYYRFAEGFGNLDRLSNPYVFVFQVAIVGAIISMVVQCFFAYRIWTFNRGGSLWLCLMICMCSTVNAVAALRWGIYAHVHKRFFGGGQLKTFALLWLIGNTATNALISTAMLYHSTRQRGHGDGPLFGHPLTKTVRLVVESHLLIFVVGFVALLMVAAAPDKIWFTCPIAILGKLYSNTFFASLNNRVLNNNSEALSARGVLSRPRTTAVVPPRNPSQVVRVDLDKHGHAFQEDMEPGRGEDVTKVIGIRISTARETIIH